jgi:hypothetical protein
MYRLISGIGDASIALGTGSTVLLHCNGSGMSVLRMEWTGKGSIRTVGVHCNEVPGSGE